MAMNKNEKEAFDNIKLMYNKIIRVTPDNVYMVVLDIMSLAQKQKKLIGPEKKTVVLEVVKLLVNETSFISEYNKSRLNEMLKEYIPNLIEFILLMSKNSSNLKIFRKGCRCF